MREITAKAGTELDLGKRGENLATRVTFDVTGWQTYGEGSFILLHKRNGDKTPYPCVVEVDNGKVFWNVTNTDTDIAGRGYAELQYIVGDVVVKSVTFNTKTTQALGKAGETPPPPAAGWLEQMVELGVQTETNATAAAEHAETAENASAEATAAAESAVTLAENAETYAALAKTYKRKAIDSAEAAAESETAAAESAAAASDSEAIAVASAEAAKNDADRAEAVLEHVSVDEGKLLDAVKAAEESAEIAVQSVAEAESAASNAATSEENAATAEQNAVAAQEAALAAQEAAEAARDEAQGIVGDVILSSEKGVAGGIAVLDEEGKIPDEHLPEMDYAPASHAEDEDNPHNVTPEQIGAAELGEDGKVLPEQLPDMEVDAYTKEETLSPSTKEALGLGEDAVPNDAFAQFGKHWWKRRTEESGYVEKRADRDKVEIYRCSPSTAATKSVTVYYADTYTFEGGKFSLNNPESRSFSYETFYHGDGFLEGQYFVTGTASDSLGTIYYCNINESDISVQKLDGGNTLYIYAYGCVELTSEYHENNGVYEYVSSPDRNAYPDSGKEGIFSYQYLAVPFENAREGAKVVTGSYVGTGTYGKNNPCSLTFDVPPKIVLMAGTRSTIGNVGPLVGYFYKTYTADLSFMMYPPYLSTEYSSSAGFGKNTNYNNFYGKKSADGKTIYWYDATSNASASTQFNISGYEYHYIAIC